MLSELAQQTLSNFKSREMLSLNLQQEDMDFLDVSLSRCSADLLRGILLHLPSLGCKTQLSAFLLSPVNINWGLD